MQGFRIWQGSDGVRHWICQGRIVNPRPMAHMLWCYYQVRRHGVYDALPTEVPTDVHYPSCVICALSFGVSGVRS